MELPQNVLIDIFHPNKNLKDEDFYKYSLKLGSYLDKIAILFRLFLKRKESNTLFYIWLFQVVDLNITKTKSYFMSMNNSSNGFILNLIYVLLQNFIQEQDLFSLISNIDASIIFTNDKINFIKNFDRVNSSNAKEYIEKHILLNTDSKYNETTHQFFIIQILISYIIQTLDYDIGKVRSQIEEYHKNNPNVNAYINDYRYLNLHSIIKSCELYMKNESFMNLFIKFNELTSLFIFTFISKNKNYKDYNFLDDLFDNASSLNPTDTNFFHSLPQFILNNVSYCLSFIKKNNSDALIKLKKSTVIICYYAMILSSNNELITNPHARLEIFKILENVLFNQPHNTLKNSLAEIIFNEQIIEKYLIKALINVYLDSDKLGVFIDKIVIRQKILNYLDRQMNLPNYTKKLADLFNESLDDISVTFISFFLNDLSYLNDECIVMLRQINQYLEIKQDTEKFNNLSHNRRWLLERNYMEAEKHYTVKIKVIILFNVIML